MTPELLAALNEVRAAKRRACLVRFLATGEQVLTVDGAAVGDAALSPEVLAAVEGALRRDASGTVDLNALSDRARTNYLFARALVGREFTCPAVQPTLH